MFTISTALVLALHPVPPPFIALRREFELDRGSRGSHDHDDHDAALAESHGSHDVGAAKVDLGLVLDGLVDWRDRSGSGTDAADSQGVAFDLRVLELDLEARYEDWLGYAVVVADGDEVELEEAAFVYSGADPIAIRGGRFFADFGAQMRLHVHELPYPERPGVLRAYVGEELPGTGAQIEANFGRRSHSVWRASLGLFSDLGSDHGHAGGAEEEAAEIELDGRRDVGDLAFTARVAQRVRTGERGRVEWGLSARHLADFTFVADSAGLEVQGLSNTVFGVDARFTNRAGSDVHGVGSGWTFGGEALLASGDVGAELDEGAPAAGDESLAVLDDDLSGWYAFGERHFDERTSLGLLVGSFEHPEVGAPTESEAVAYLTRRIGSAARLSFFAGTNDSDEDGETVRIGIRLTAVFGPHSHARWGGFER